LQKLVENGPAPPVGAQVRRRRVYYLSGFDPRGARHYHQMWRGEAAKQGRVDGRHYEIGSRSRDGKLAVRWTVRSGADDPPVESQHVFLCWDDLIRKYWPHSRWQVALRLIPYYWRYARCGALGRTFRQSRWTGVSIAGPLITATIGSLIAALTGWGLAALAGLAGLPPAGQAAAAALGAAVFLWLTLRFAEGLRHFWLGRINLFMLLWAREAPPDLAQRWRGFARLIQDDLERDAQGAGVDEVVVVGHSIGAVVAVCVLQEWLALQPANAAPTAPVKLLTLGHVIPMAGFVPEAQWLRDALAALGSSSIPWLDMTAPSDILCYPLVDPYAACGVARTSQPYRLQSARFDRMLEPATLRRMRLDPFTMHFQYLMSTQRPVANDWFQLTCGPRPLAVA
jgi:hypothetical protein